MFEQKVSNEELKLVVESYQKLKDNDDFKRIVNYYTKTFVDENASRLPYASDARPELFEKIICSKRFEEFINILENIISSKENEEEIENDNII